ncbi:hypothetical protein Daura_32695 [Dactylosporangium aurantiacum]|uniref:Uncharacterized protein n=1 Tax=Dactylosporangium aurantiacum TaxID=35754 RepID=A0A9Q9IE25_9ACTN|nr:hypothetical protein [Dactylosporangium aurantiacum]MDG6107199.1 hypothetical protein [Dactylosporangium aurantiacum]UWZ51493.1 hypothetical protein Daura_32695 [Dactylosporangium aurantiacum]
MSHQQLFEPVLADEPPARDTLDGLVRRSRRRVRHRRLATAGVGLVAAGVVVVLALPGAAPPAMTGAPPTTGPATAPPTGTTSIPLIDPSIGPSTPARPASVLLGEDLTEPNDVAPGRLTDAFTAVLKQVAPQAWHDALIIKRQVTSSTWNADLDSPRATIGYDIQAEIHVDGVAGTLVVTLKRRAVDAGCAAAFPPDVSPAVLRAQCAGPARPGTTQTVRDEEPGMVRHVAWRDRTDGSGVGASLDNRPALDGAAPPLTLDQVAAIAADPRLTLYP